MIIAGRYRVVAHAGAGAEARTLTARDLQDEQGVVLKAVSLGQTERLRAEYAILSGLRHPNVVEVLDLVEDAGTLYLVEREAEGASFRAWARAQGQPLRSVRAAAAIARALEYLHSLALVHGDLSPENVRVSDQPIGILPGVKLIDFGLARAAGVAPRRVDLGASGTLAYAAPEVLAGDEPTAASDVYALGALLFEVLFGSPPNAGLDPRLTRIDVPCPAGCPPALREVLVDLLQVDPGRRPSAGALLGQLERVLGEPLQITLEELRGPYYPRPPLVGRADVLEQLDAIIADITGREQARGGDAARRSRVRLVQLTGAGKTSVARAVRTRARLRGVAVVDGTRALQQIVGSGASVLDVAAIAARLVDAWLTLGAQGPLLVDLDGCPPGDEILEEIFAQLRASARSAGPTRLVVISSQSTRGGFGEDVALPALAAHEVRQMVRQMLYHLPEPHWLSELEGACHGDPRWVADAVRAQIDAGLPPELSVASEPSALERAHIARLSPAQRTALRLVAISPFGLSAAILEALLPDASGALEQLQQRGLVQQEGTELRISRPLWAELALEGLDEADARAWHSRLHRAWGESGGDEAVCLHHRLRSGDFSAEVLESPLLGPEDLTWAIHHVPADSASFPSLLVRFARSEARRGRLARALAHADRLAASDRASGLVLRAELLLDAGRLAEARAALQELPAPAASSSMLLQARAHFLAGEYEQALTSAERGLASASARDPVTRAALAHLVGLSALYCGREDAALERLLKARELVEAHALKQLEPRVLNSTAIALQARGDHEAARALLERAQAAARVSGDVRLGASIAVNRATLAQQALDLSAALAGFDQGYELAARARATSTQISALANRANLLLLCGALGEASDALDEASELLSATGTPASAAQLRLYRVELEIAAGNASAARIALHAARENGADEAQAELLELQLLLAEHAIDPARQLASSLLARLPESHALRAQVELLAAKTALLAHDGAALPCALAELQRARAHVRQGLSDRLWELEGWTAQCLLRLGRHGEAKQHLGSAARELDNLRQRVPPHYRGAFDARSDVRAVETMLRASHVEPDDAPDGRDFARLLELNKELNQQRPVLELLQRILDCAIDLTGAERGFVLLREGERLRVAAARNVDGESVKRGMQKLSRSIAEATLREGRPLVAADAMADERFAAQVSVHGLKLRAVLCVPLRVGGVERGAVYIDNRFRIGAFTRRHTELMQAFAEQAGLALYNAQLLQEGARQRAELAQARAALQELNEQLSAQVAQQSAQLGELTARLRGEQADLVRRYNRANLIGRSKPMCELFAQLDRLVEADVAVFICGESGTGKELVARALHYEGPRREHPFVTVNCAAIPHALLESELFGHVRGAYTGAVRDRRGLFEAAGRGTLLLDEIGDMPLDMQAKLLRILQEGRFRPVGGQIERQSLCRIISAGQRPLEELVSEGRFRQDLLYRVNVVQLNVPALRERREDIPLLVEHFLQQLGAPRRLTADAMAALLDHDWPGNVRQLQNELQRASLLAGELVELSALSPAVARRVPAAAGARSGARHLDDALEAYERGLIEQALEASRGQVTAAARALGLSRVVLHRKIARLGIEVGRYR